MKKFKLLMPILGATTLASAAIPVVTSCGCGTTTEATISFTEPSFILAPGETRTLKVTVTGASQDVTWKSSNEAVVTVKNGVITAVADGDAVITATANEKSATCNVKVTTETIITLNHTELALEPGTADKLTATVTPTATVTWKSSDEKIAKVASDGTVLAVATGTADITASANGKSVVCKLTVAQTVPSETDVAYLTTINGLMHYGDDYVAPHKALEALKDMGYDVLNYKLSSNKLEFAFDASVKKFIIMNNDTVVAAPTGYKMTNSQVVFKFTNSYDKDSKYGQYLLDDYVWDDPEEQFDVIASIDVGNNKNIKNMNYTSGSSNAGTTKLIRTYCEYLNFEKNNDTIFHMGESNNINVYGKDTTNVCNYMELGRTGYLYAEDTKLQLAKISSVDTCQIDVLEVGNENVTKGDVFHEDYITILTGYEIEGVTKEYTSLTTVTTLQNLKDAFAGKGTLIRLLNDITIDSTVTSTIAITDRSFVLDLNGHTLKDESGVAVGSALFNIQAADADSSLIFMDCCRQGVIDLNDHYINVEGNADTARTGMKTATLYLEGVHITYDATAKRNGAIEIGTAAEVKTTTEQTARVFMYGGKIEANTESTSHDTEVSGIYLKDNAYAQLIYGAIYSSVNCVRTLGSAPNSYVDIVDGTYKTISSTLGECIYLPTGKLNIVGGTFEGHTCLGIRGGNTNISGGYFHSTGANDPIDKAAESGSGISGDGSVICVQLTNEASSTAYGTNPSITIHNATLYSEQSYILQIFRNNSDTTINQFLEVDFFGGVYYYAEEASTIVYNGIRLGDAGSIADHCRINQDKGSWVHIGE